MKKNALTDLIRFAKLTRMRPASFALSTGLLLAASALEAVSIGLVIPLLDALVKQGDFSLALRAPFVGPFLREFPDMRLRSVMLIFIAGILVAVALKNLLTFTSELLLSRMTRAAEHELRIRVFERYLSFSKTFIDRNKIGALCNLAAPQVMNACEIYSRIHGMMLNVMSSAVYVTMMLLISWKLTLCAAVMMPPFYLLGKMLSKKIQAGSQWRFTIDQGMAATLLDALSNLTMIHAYTNEKEEAARYERISRSSSGAMHGIAKKVAFMWRFQDFLVTAATAALLAVSLFFFLKEGAVSGVAFFMAFFIVLRRFSASGTSASANFVEAAKMMAPLRRLLWIFDDADKAFVTEGSVPFAGLEREIEYRGVGFRHEEGSSAVLEDVDLSFQKGRFTAIVGPTGAGKTTLVNLLMRFYDPTSGAIFVDGRPIREYALRSLRMKIALVEQTAPVLNATIRENVAYGLADATPARIDEAVRLAALSGFVARLPQGLETVVGDRGVRLSGGERQRIAIARAILKDPDIFIFDEATSSLDMETETLIQTSLEQVFRGRTVVVIAHRLATIRRADTILFMSGGKVAESGTFDELIARNGAFRRQWELASF